MNIGRLVKILIISCICCGKWQGYNGYEGNELKKTFEGLLIKQTRVTTILRKKLFPDCMQNQSRQFFKAQAIV